MPDLSAASTNPSGPEKYCYKDFDVDIISKGSGQGYLINCRSPSGEAHEIFQLSYNTTDLKRQLDLVRIAVARAGAEEICLEDEKAVREFGIELFNSLFTGKIRTRFDTSIQEVERQGMGLRLRIHFVEAPELAILPWEFLFDDCQGDYICLSQNTPIVRHLDLQGKKSLSVKPPLRILGMLAVPKDQNQLDVDNERKLVENAIKPLEERGLLKLVWMEGHSLRDLQKEMDRRGPWHIFHFIGHGEFDEILGKGKIDLTGNGGNTNSSDATQLARILADHKYLRLVIINACEGARGSQNDIFSSTSSILIQHGIPAVIAMQYEISDKAALEFSSAFYESLANGSPVDTSVSYARKAVSSAFAKTVEWGTPVLHLRSPDGVLFNLEHYPSTPHVPAEESSPQTERVLTPSEYLNQGVEFYHLGKYKEAIESYDNALAVNPTYTYAWRYRGMALSNLGRYKDAIKSYDEAIAINRDDAGVWFNRAVDLYNLGLYKESVASYDEAIAKNINDEEAVWYGRAIALYNDGQYKESVASFDKVLAINPDSAVKPQREEALKKQKQSAL